MIGLDQPIHHLRQLFAFHSELAWFARPAESQHHRTRRYHSGECGFIAHSSDVGFIVRIIVATRSSDTDSRVAKNVAARKSGKRDGESKCSPSSSSKRLSRSL